MMSGTPLGFRIRGGIFGQRRLIDWRDAFHAYCACERTASTDEEAYLSAFVFGDDFEGHLQRTFSTRGYSGACGIAWLWFDIDETGGGISDALENARRLAVTLQDAYGVDEAMQLWFFSGSKGFHCGIPASLWDPTPDVNTHRVARHLAETIAESAGACVDLGVYDRVRAFRAPNSRHPATGRHKRRFATDEILNLRADAIIDASAEPLPFAVPPLPAACSNGPLSIAWQQARADVQAKDNAVTHGNAEGTAHLNRLTLEFIREGAPDGSRHTRLFSAAANLHEFGAPPELVRALLEESALDSGLPPRDVERQIRCGLSHGGNS